MNEVDFLDFINDVGEEEEFDTINRRLFCRSNPFEIYNDQKFFLRYRFKKDVLRELSDSLQRQTKCHYSLSVDTK
uniref:Uncharacterized protein n=1 Tax=Romanomermis culicivorax TaxID=13658 RepID=A0A915KTJ8_ROMCU